MKRIRFSIEQWETGDYNVVTRDGRNARILATDVINEFDSPIAAAITNEKGYEIIQLLNKLGRMSKGGFDSYTDLYLVKKEFLKVGDLVSCDGEKFYFISIIKESGDEFFIYLLDEYGNRLDFTEKSFSHFRKATLEEREQFLKKNGCDYKIYYKQ